MSVQLRVDGSVAFIEFDHPDAKVNILTADVLRRLDGLLDEVSKNTSLKALFLVSKKKDIFIAGADIKEIEGIVTSEEGEKKSKAGQRIFDKLEDLTIPTVAVIDGVALGGGCELALACRYRIATFSEKVRIGLPEVNLGIIPGFGGTYRMPKVLGLERGIRMIVTCKVVSSSEALKIGLVDRLIPQKGMDNQLRQFVQDIEEKKLRPKPEKNIRQRLLEDFFLGRAILFKESRKVVLEASKGFYPAPLKALEVIKKSVGRSRRDALDLEAKGFSEMVITDVSKNLVKLFYLSEKYKKLTFPGTENLPLKKIQKAAVLGAGVMGGGIAQLLSYNGISVRFKDINYDAIALGLKSAKKIYTQAVQKKRLTQAQANVKMSAVTGTLDYSGFENADVVIEAVVENLEIKKKVFHELSAVVSADAILCTNTSALSVTEMAKETRDPSKVIGLHFFNPVHRMPLIEVIKTDVTSKETIASTLSLVKLLGKTPILVKDSCGFLVNRILLTYMNEAGHLLEEGASIGAIDRIATDFGMPMGPFALSDEVGLDVGVKVLHILENGFGPRFKAVETFERVLAAKFLGKKSGKGFYVYGRTRSVNPKVHSLIAVKSKRTIDPKESLKRMMYVMINEAARCLEDKIIDDPGAVDIGMIMGTGFPPFRGGLLRYADSVGIENIVRDLEHLATELKAERFKPCRYLLTLKNFYA